MNKKYTNILPTIEEALEGVTNLFASEEAATNTGTTKTKTTKTTNTMEEVFKVIGREFDLHLSLYQWYRYVQVFHDVNFVQVEYIPNDWELLNRSRTENNGTHRIETYINKKARHSNDKHITIVKLIDYDLSFAVEGADIHVVTNALLQELPYSLTSYVEVDRNLFNNFITFKNRITGESYTTMMGLEDIDIEEISVDLALIFTNVNIDEGEWENLLELAAYVDYFYCSSYVIKLINTTTKQAFERAARMYNYEKLQEILQSLYALTDTIDTEEEKTLVTLLEEMQFYLNDLPFDEDVVEFADILFEEIEEVLYYEKKEIVNEYDFCYIEVDNVTGEILNTPLTLKSDREDLVVIKELKVCYVCNKAYYYNQKLGMYISENDDCSHCKYLI